MTTLASILGKVATVKGSQATSNNGQTKTASAQPQGTDKSSVDSAIESVLATMGTQKTASSEESPVNTLVKLAEQTAAIDKEAEVKHAQLVGRAMASGFVSELNDYSKAAAEMTQQKLASEGVTEEDLALIKLARENPDEFLRLVQQNAGQDKLAADQLATLEKFAAEDPKAFEAAVKEGFDATTEQLTKQAQAEYEEGYNDAVREIHKKAAEHFAAGFDAITTALSEQNK